MPLSWDGWGVTRAAGEGRLEHLMKRVKSLPSSVVV